MDQPQLVERAKSLIDDLATTPRFAGSEQEARARGRCRSELEKTGFNCRELPFEYSQWIGRWGPPVLAIASACILIALARIALTGNRVAAVASLLIPWALSALGANSIRQQWLLDFPWSRAHATNLEARRGDPNVWLVAHLDSKSQTVPMLLRIAGSISLLLAAFLIFVAAPITSPPGGGAASLILAAQVFAIVGAIAVGLCWVTNNSPGAVDNATGVAAVILAATSGNAPASLGVLITSGEELGLAGALAWSRTAPEDLVILNCDTVDERGVFRCMYTGTKPRRVLAAAEGEAKNQGVKLKVGRLIPGILADSMVFGERSRWNAVTLSRGTLGTLARIHTRGDNSTRLTGEGAAQASVLLSAMARELS